VTEHTFFKFGISNELVDEMLPFHTATFCGLSSSSISLTLTEQVLVFFFGGAVGFAVTLGFRVHVGPFPLLASGIVFEGSISAICEVV